MTRARRIRLGIVQLAMVALISGSTSCSSPAAGSWVSCRGDPARAPAADRGGRLRHLGTCRRLHLRPPPRVARRQDLGAERLAAGRPARRLPGLRQRWPVHLRGACLRRSDHPPVGEQRDEGRRRRSAPPPLPSSWPCSRRLGSLRSPATRCPPIWRAGSLPKHAVLIAFDGGRVRDWTVADSLLARYDYSGVALIDPALIAGRGLGNLSWTQLDQMTSSGRWSVALDFSNPSATVALDAAGATGPALLEHAWLPSAGRAETTDEFEARVRDTLAGEIADIANHGLAGPRLLMYPFDPTYPLSRAQTGFNELTSVVNSMVGAGLLRVSPDAAVTDSIGPSGCCRPLRCTARRRRTGCSPGSGQRHEAARDRLRDRAGAAWRPAGGRRADRGRADRARRINRLGGLRHQRARVRRRRAGIRRHALGLANIVRANVGVADLIGGTVTERLGQRQPVEPVHGGAGAKRFGHASSSTSGPKAPITVAVEFDDGTADQYQTSALLKARTMSGVYFVNSGRLGLTDEYLMPPRYRAAVGRQRDRRPHGVPPAPARAVRRRATAPDLHRPRPAARRGLKVTDMAIPFGEFTATTQPSPGNAGT